MLHKVMQWNSYGFETTAASTHYGFHARVVNESLIQGETSIKSR